MEPQFSLVTNEGTRVSQIGNFIYPRNLTLSTNGDVYVADWGHHTTLCLCVANDFNAGHDHRKLASDTEFKPADIL